MKKSSYPWLFSVIILAVLLIISLILGFTGYFFSLSTIRSSSDLTLGESICINVSPNETSVASFTFDGNYLPGEKLPQVIQIKANNLDKNLKLRVKAEVFSSDKLSKFDFVTTDDFVNKNDGYFYLTGELAGGNKITFSNYVVMPENSVFKSKDKYILSIIVENLDATLPVEDIWPESV